ncbi:MAG: 23S rRNA (guanosine(2251)-2'-O)-methyltransferase RlmB [Chitinivibrionales bacterium]|nr:23S rRNA (guanosine(2251)-2'-O)-methyltransferase RlmB [Chitinivibrionales bacterium]MBD3395673.1 23S rRNA (guanosine(2251)-2'-O)-methyltransferase RlmB [Chitinivibrionales bacterium]
MNKETLTHDIVYGIHPAHEVLRERPDRIHRVFFSNAAATGRTFSLLKQCRKNRLPYQLVPPGKLADLAGSTKHQGVVIQCSVKPYADIDAVLEQNATVAPLLLVPASVEDPRNLGALIRSAVAFGVTAVLVERKHSAHLNATVAKASAGMLEHMPVARPRSLEAALGKLRQKGYALVGALAGTEVQPREVDFTGPCAIIVGGEHRGIPPYLRSLCTHAVGISTARTVESLNVSVAASILLYECSCQRARAGRG